jgi:hypothetical protein
MHHPAIVNNLREASRKKDSELTLFLLRMKEMGMKIGKAKNETFTGRPRQSVVRQVLSWNQGKS